MKQTTTMSRQEIITKSKKQQPRARSNNAKAKSIGFKARTNGSKARNINMKFKNNK
jgi:hypothetical protein